MAEREPENRPEQSEISEGFHDLYRKMTDPEEQEKEVIKNQRKEYVSEQNDDAGL